MLRTGVRAAVALSGVLLAALGVSAVPAIADFSGKFPGKGSYAAWDASWKVYDQALASEKRGDMTAAENFYRRVITLYPYDAEAYYDLGLFLNRRGRYKDADPFLRKSVQMQPVFQNWHQLGVSEASEQRLSEAEHSFLEAQRLAKTDKQRQAVTEDLNQLRRMIKGASK